MKAFTLVLFSFVYATLSLAETPTPKEMLEKFEGCYTVSLNFTEVPDTYHSNNFMKEMITMKAGANGAIVHKHTTIVDSQAHGDDPIIKGFKKALKQGEKPDPVVFPHLSEVWTEVDGKKGQWNQSTLFGRRKIFECTGTFTDNQWDHCTILGHRLLRRDRNKSRTDFNKIDIRQHIKFILATNGQMKRVEVTQANIKYLLQKKKEDAPADKKIIAIESGKIIYKRIDDKFCVAATK